MTYNKIFIKLSTIIMLIFLIVLIPLGFIMDKIFTNTYIENIKQETEQISKNYADMAHTLNGMSVMMAGPLSEMTNKDILVFNLSGNPMINSSVNHYSISQSDLKQLDNGDSVSHLINLKSLGHYFLSGQPIKSTQGDVIGSILVFSSVEDINGTLDNVRILLLISSIGALFMALGFTYIISKQMSDPLIRMEKATRKIAKGNLSTRVQVSSQDEIGSLASAINDLAFEIEKYRTTRQEFFANVSHELKTPVTYLAGYARVLKEGVYETKREHDQYVEIIENESNRINHLINDLFELSKIEEGRMSLNLEPIDMTEIMENVKQKVQLSAKKKGINIQYDYASNIGFINGDGERLEQIFMNLINNAIRYTEEGFVFVKIYKEFNDIIVSISDTGIGIPEAEISNIFDRFYRVEKSRSRDFGGTGLGLSIVKNLTELHSGTINVSSKEGEGTTVKLSFPMIDGEMNT